MRARTTWISAQGEPTVTLLLRHGQTPMSVQKRYAGLTDAPLTDTGIRQAVAADVPAELLALYDQIRKTKGVGAAMLRAGRCEGCHLSLNAADLNVIRASAPEEVVRCEECRRILVRTPESGI